MHAGRDNHELGDILSLSQRVITFKFPATSGREMRRQKGEMWCITKIKDHERMPCEVGFKLSVDRWTRWFTVSESVDKY